jgi:hypothetical protein
MAQKGTDFDSVKANSRSDKVKVTDLINVYKFPEKKWVTGRLNGVIHSYATGWVKSKTKDGKATKFPVNMPSYDPDTQQFDSSKYDPWYEIYLSEKDVEREKQTVQVGKKFYCDFLVRNLQRQKPSTRSKPTAQERKTGFKDKDSETWTPWTCVALPPGLIQKIQELKGLNTVTSKKTGATKAFSVADEKYGRDVRIYFDSTKSPAEQYQIQMGETRTPLTEEELGFLRWDHSNLAPETDEEEVKRDFESWAKRMGVKLGKKKRTDDDDEIGDDDDDEDAKPSRSKKKTTSKKPSKKVQDDDDEDLDEDDEDEDDVPPPKSKKGKLAAKSKKVVEDDDEDEDDDSDDEDSDDDSDDEDDDLDSDDDDSDEDSDSDDDGDDDEDEDDEPPAKSKGKSKVAAKSKSKKVVDDDEDDEDLDDEDEDEDEDSDDEDEDDTPPPPKKSSKSKPVSKPAAKTSKSKKKPEPDEDEDEDLDDDGDDLDDDEDDTPPPPAKKKPAAKAPAKKTAKRK